MTCTECILSLCLEPVCMPSTFMAELQQNPTRRLWVHVVHYGENLGQAACEEVEFWHESLSILWILKDEVEGMVLNMGCTMSSFFWRAWFKCCMKNHPATVILGRYNAALNSSEPLLCSKVRRISSTKAGFSCGHGANNRIGYFGAPSPLPSTY